MGPTLFRYIFADLLRVFALALLVIAGIMSFAGLLRPLAERGLDGGQIIRMVAWLVPAMGSYSLPVAALFATTFVYGRLAADNEVVAMRAAGIPTGLSGLVLPALVLATLVMVANFVLLSFVVPAANLQVERVIYSNLARLSANEINRSKRLTLNSGQERITLTAEKAVIIDPSEVADAPGVSDQTQIVQLHSVYLLRYDNLGSKRDPYEVPREIFTARRATAFIEPPAHYREGAVFETALRDDWFMLTVVLEGGAKIPRLFQGAEQPPLLAAVDASQIGPLPLASPVRQNTKFLDLRELRRLHDEPLLGRDVSGYLRDIGQREQKAQFLTQLWEQARSAGAQLDAVEGHFTLYSRDAQQSLSDGRLQIASGEGGIELVQRRPQETLTVTAPQVVVSATPLRLSESMRMLVVFNFESATVRIEPQEGEPVITRGRPFERRALIEMPPHLVDLTERGEELLQSGILEPSERDHVNSRLKRLRNSVLAEIHARMSFAISCLVLPIVGGALGLMFRSGNFLTAFAACVLPALISVSMIVMGQTNAENVPVRLGDGSFSNPMPMALAMIWGGNAFVALAATLALWRLRRN